MTGPPLLAAAAVVALAAGSRPRARLPQDHRPLARTRSSVRSVLQAALERADLDARVADPLRAWTMAAVSAALAGLAVGGATGGLAGAMAGAVAPVVVVLLRGDRTPARVARHLPGALEATARSLRSGASLTTALAESAGQDSDVGRDLLTVVEETGAGLPLAASLSAWAHRRPDRSVRLAAAALRLAAEAGGPQARTIDEIAVVLREQQGQAAEARALSSQARASALVIGVAPVGFAAVVALIDPERASSMLGTPVGVVSVAAGLVLDLVGVVWMRRIVAHASGGAT